MRTAIYAMHVTRTKHLFVAGSFISHPLTQRLVEEEFEYARWGRAMSFENIVSRLKRLKLLLFYNLAMLASMCIVNSSKVVNLKKMSTLQFVPFQNNLEDVISFVSPLITQL